MPASQALAQPFPALARDPVPRLELLRQAVILPGPGGTVREVETAALRLWFRYGDLEVRAADPRAEAQGVLRDLAAEDEARRHLESFGVVDLACSEAAVAPLEADVDYVVDADHDAAMLCDFSTVALPRLRAAGWIVDEAADYPCHVVTSARWCAGLAVGDASGNWFELQLGVEIDGEIVDLLPVLLEMIDRGLEVARRRKQLALPVGDDRYLPVPTDRLTALLEIVRELYEIDGRTRAGGLRLPTALPALFERVSDCVEEVAFRGPAPVRRGARVTPSARHAAAVTLRPYQVKGVAWLDGLAERGLGGILADDMGLGKTLQTITHLAGLAPGARAPALVVVPTSLVGNWRRELRRFAPQLRVCTLHGPRRHAAKAQIAGADVLLTTYPVLVRDVDDFVARAFSTVVLDEAHAVKNARSQAYQAVRALQRERLLCLSGTPVENHLEELRALVELCAPGLLGDAGAFRRRFRDPIERQGDLERLALLRRRIGPFLLRREKAAVAKDLPPKVEIVRTVTLGEAQRELYEGIRVSAHAAVRGAIAKRGLAQSSIDVLAALTKLRQVCCDPSLLPLDAARAVTDSAKLEALVEMLHELRSEGRRTLVFSQFTSMLEIISRALHSERVPHLALTGESRDRQALVDAFESGQGDVFLVSLKAGGTGLNLTSADTVIHYDPWWNPAAQNQATDRAHRIGQARTVHVYRLIVAGSVEERMLALQDHKRLLAEGLLTDTANPRLDAREVEELLAPLDDARLDTLPSPA